MNTANQEKRDVITRKQSVIILGLSLLAVVAALAVHGRAQSVFLNDGGFAAHGERLGLRNWNDLGASAAGQPPPKFGLQLTEDGGPNSDSWINTGQHIVLNDVPVSARSVFRVEVRISPNWQRSASEAVEFLVVAKANGEELRASVPAQQSDSWQTLELQFPHYPEKYANIYLAPVAAEQGIWTFWRNPRIEPLP